MNIIENSAKKQHIIRTFGIILIMSIFCCLNVCAKTSYKKFARLKVAGVMATAVDNNVVVTWEGVQDADGYDVYEIALEDDKTLVKTTSSCKAVLECNEPGSEHRYYVVAYRLTNNGSKGYCKKSCVVATTVPVNGKSTIKNLLRTAIAPIGSTMYVWGGGWNKADTAAGKEARRTGLSSSWRKFAKDKKADYNYRNYRYLIHKGLDCSGYVGWCIYNVMNTENGKKGYVYSASKQAKKFSDMGFGKHIKRADVKDYRPGDILSSECSCCGHVWICIGQCDDGSVVIAHASPPGVSLSGTVAADGSKNSKAVKLAKKYMKKYYPDWYKKYPDVCKGYSYLTHYGQMRWYTDGEDAVLSDPEGFTDMSAEEVLKDLYEN